MKHSKEYEEKKELMEQKHQLRMEELKYIRETNNLDFQNRMEMHRLQRADRQRYMDRKERITDYKNKTFRGE